MYPHSTLTSFKGYLFILAALLEFLYSVLKSYNDDLKTYLEGVDDRQKLNNTRIFMVTKGLIWAFTGTTFCSTKKDAKNIVLPSDSNTGLPHNSRADSRLRKVARQRYTRNLLTDKSHQGVVANCLSLDGTSLDMARLVSCRTPLFFRDWRYLHRARLDILPLRGHSWFCSQQQETSCRRCGKENETGYHVLNLCEEVLQLATKRHNTVQDLLETLLVKQAHNVTVNKAIPDNV
ncbi:hypothetical protein OUZ56_017041 [Daphnia magna]|uniref:Reverse transcriptase zinc-binding domain-containing protein n=1 Tax=Daphnia magna TaxID=35525 RepID=A0ABR0AS01_9CRUS|nr:hypothetical protein OUZ56_017041 [Daphnia magna]